MSEARYLPRADYLRLRLAQKDLVADAGGVRRAERVTGYPHQALSRICSDSEEHADRWLRLDFIADLEASIDRPVVTAMLAELLGMVLVKLPEAGTPDAVGLVARVSEMLREVSDVSGGVATALRDARVTRREARALHREVKQAIQKLVEIDRDVALAAGAKPEDGEDEE